MDIKFVADTKETRIDDLVRRRKNKLISTVLFNRAMSELEKGYSISYIIDFETSVVVDFRVIIK